MKSIQVVITDSYHINDNYRKRLKDEGFSVVSISDIGFESLEFDIDINSNLNAEKIIFPVNNRKQLLGIKYLIMPKEFWVNNQNICCDKISNVLITMGGIDHYNFSSKLIEMLEFSDLNFDINIIIGPYYENVNLIKEKVKMVKRKINLIFDPPSLYKYMINSSVAFCAGGQTLYELLSLGIPTVGIALWKNQYGNIKQLSKFNVIKGILYEENSAFYENLDGIINELLHNKKIRKDLSNNGKNSGWFGR